MCSSLPPLAPFPKPSWRRRLGIQEWHAAVQAWQVLIQAHLSLSDDSFLELTASDSSVASFASTFVTELSYAGGREEGSGDSRPLFQPTLQLISRLLALCSPPAQLLEYRFLASLAQLYPKKRVAPLLSSVFDSHAAAKSSLATAKKDIVLHLEQGINGDLRVVESQLCTLNLLLHACPQACAFFLADSDFFDGLVACFRVTNPPLRKVIVATTYLCLVGLTETPAPKWIMLSDELFSLTSAADAHKQGPLNVESSLVAELVTATPLLAVLLRRAHATDAALESSLKKRISALELFRKGPMIRPRRLARNTMNKGKGNDTLANVETQKHRHRRSSQIAQIKDVFPDLGSGFVSKCLDEYDEVVEEVVANIIGETLPAHLAEADWREPLNVSHHQAPSSANMASSDAPVGVWNRRNVFDDDEFDRLAADASKISFGKRPDKTADEMLSDKSTAPSKAAILSALAAFDSDEDERDDTYDAADVGGTVDLTHQEADGVGDGIEQVLFRAYTTDDKAFTRDGPTRRGNARAKLREETGMIDEAIEGWAVMLVRNPAQMKRLEAKYAFSGQQPRLERTTWRPSSADAGAGASESKLGGTGRGGQDGARRAGRGRGRGGSVAGPAGDRNTEAARKNKAAHKGSRANHNRRDAHARKMARGGPDS